MRLLIVALSLPVFVSSFSSMAFADDERTADYGSTPTANTVIEKKVTPQGDTQVKASDESSLNPVDKVRSGFNYGADEDLNEASEAAVIDGESYTTRTTEERRDSVPRVQELGF